MFAPKDTQATLAKLTTRTEKHGGEDVPAISLQLKINQPSKVLDLFHHKLRPTFFGKPSSGEQQALPMEPGDEETALSIPQIEGFGWSEEYPGYALKIGTGLKESKPLVLKNCTLSKFQFHPINGGAVTVTVSVACGPTGDQVAKLYEWQGQDLAITLTPPKSATDTTPAQGDLAALPAE